MSEKIQAVIEELEKFTVVEINELVKTLEERWGVSAAAAAPVMVSAGGGAVAEEDAGPVEKTEFDVLLKEVGDAKLQVIKTVREITGLGLKEAKEKVDAIPTKIKEKVSKADAEEAAAKLKEAGAIVELV